MHREFFVFLRVPLFRLQIPHSGRLCRRFDGVGHLAHGPTPLSTKVQTFIRDEEMGRSPMSKSPATVAILDVVSVVPVGVPGRSRWSHSSSTTTWTHKHAKPCFTYITMYPHITSRLQKVRPEPPDGRSGSSASSIPAEPEPISTPWR